MTMTLSGDGSITGLAAGGLPNSSVITADIADAAITAAKLDGAQSGSAPIYGARAWVNFNGTGTVAISASGNVSSITDNGTGDYTINFTSSMPDGNYSFAGSGGNATGSLPLYALMPYSNAMLTGSCRFHVNFVSGTAEDPTFVAALIIR